MAGAAGDEPASTTIEAPIAQITCGTKNEAEVERPAEPDDA